MTVLEKMSKFKEVSGLSLSRRKYEFLAINCREEDAERLSLGTQMRRVQTLKHLGLHIDDEGRLQGNVNIDPMVNAMSSISKTLSTVSSTPLGRALYAKYLLASKYIHRIQNYNFNAKKTQGNCSGHDMGQAKNQNRHNNEKGAHSRTLAVSYFGLFTAQVSNTLVD